MSEARGWAAGVGARIHVAVARCAAEGADPMGPAGMRIIAPLVADVPDGPARRAVLQQTRAAASVYFRLLLPPPGWRGPEAEVPLGAGRADLVWASPAGFLVDEVKSGPWWLAPPGRASALGQVERYRRAGVSAWGRRFAGVRLCSTAGPSRSLLVLPGGEAVEAGGSGMFPGLEGR